MSTLACYPKHKKPVCDRCDARTNCVSCCMCTPRAARGRPRKESESPSEPPSSSPLVQRVNPERAARDRVLDSNAIAETPEKEDISQVSSSQAHILDVLELMGCKEHESSVRRLPHIDNRCQVVNASEADIDATAMQRVDNVFLRGVKAWIHLLLPNLKLKCDSKLKAVCSIMSMAEEQLIAGQSTDELEIDEEDDVPTSVTTPIDVSMLTTIPNIIREVLQHETRYTSTDARKLLVPLSHVPSEYLASILRISNSYAKRLSFQAKVDQLYLIHGVKLQEFNQTHSRVHVDMIQSAVDFVYSEGNIGRLAWEVRKRSPNRNLRWKDLENVFAMRSLVLKHDIATMYKVYSERYKDAIPGKSPIGRSIFYSIARTITGGGKQQEARAGVDYIKVNFHTDNFAIMDKVIDLLAPLSDLDHTLRDELRLLRTDVYTFLSYGYAVHVKEGVKASDEHAGHCHIHVPQVHENQLFNAYQELEKLAAQSDRFDEAAFQKVFVDQVCNQLILCEQSRGTVASDSNNATTHSPVFSLDLAPQRKPNKTSKAGGHLECSACRSPFLFYDKLRKVCMAKVDEDPIRLSEVADILLTIHQCERRTYRYMAHVMLASQQAYHTKKAIAQMDSDTAYMVFDFKQKFLAKGFREGGDSYYGKKGILWWGAGVYVKADSKQDGRCISESRDALYVEINFTRDKARLQNLSVETEEDGMVSELTAESIEGIDGATECEKDACGMEDDELEWKGIGEDDFLGEEVGFGEEGCEEGEQGFGEEGCEEREGVLGEGEGFFGEGEEEGDMESEEDTGEQEREDAMTEEGKDCQAEGEVGDMEEDGDLGSDNVALHFIDCIVQDEQKADANVVLSCLEAAMHALKHRFPYLTKIIVQSDNAKNLAGKQTKQFLPYVSSAAGLKLVGYFHNEAQSGKDVCDTHFSHQQTQVDAYLAQGEGGRKVSTPKQLAVALVNTSVRNTTVLLVKPDFGAPYRTASIPAIPGISTFYATQYVTVAGEQQMWMFDCLGQKVPSLCVPIVSCHASSMISPMGKEGINFTGVTVTLNSDGDDVCKQVRKERRRYKKRCLSISKREEHRVEKQHKDEEALNAIRIVYPQCTVCLYHFKSQVLLEGHVCGGLNEPKDALSVAMKYANQLLTKMNFTIRGAIDQASVMFQMEGTSEILFASFEPNFFPGWAHIRKNIHPELTNKVSSVIHECWKAGENKGTGKVKISADGVFERLEEMQSHNLIRLSELPVVGKIRAVYQCVGNKPQAPIGVRKRGRPHDSGSGDCGGRNVKNRVSFEQLDVGKELSTWKKPELEAYLHHFQLKKSGNKPDLIKRVEEHMAMQ